MLYRDDLTRYALPDPMREAAEKSQRYAAGDSIASITIVGALFLDFENYSNFDSKVFKRLFDYTLKSGLAISPDVQIRAANFLLDGQDYLAGHDKADLTFISYVPMDDGLYPNHSDNVIASSSHKPLLETMHLFQDALHRRDYAAAKQIAEKAHRFQPTDNSAERWQRRLAASDSKIIASLFNGGEVDLNQTMPKQYVALGSEKPMHNYRDDPTIVNDEYSGYDSFGWQFVGEPDFVERSFMLTADKKTELAHAITRNAERLSMMDEPVTRPAFKKTAPLTALAK